MEIKEEYENWYKVSDYKKRVGWVSKTQLSNTRYGILIKNNQKLYKFPNLNSKQLALVKSDYIFRILKCKKSKTTFLNTSMVRDYIAAINCIVVQTSDEHIIFNVPNVKSFLS